MHPDLSENSNSQPTAGLIKDSDSQNFTSDVIEASKSVPVLVDFWAPWCGPCKQLGPTIEKVVTKANGKVQLVKIDIDQNPDIAGQMGIKSIPAVIAFVNGQPIDGFMGAIPETEIGAFVDKVVQAAPPAPQDPAAQIEEALSQANAAMEAGDFATGSQIYSQILQFDQKNDAAIIGIATIHSKIGDIEQAKQTLESVSEEGQNLASYVKLYAALDLLEQAHGLGEISTLIAKAEKDPSDHQAKFDLAIAYNADDKRVEAAQSLVDIIRIDRDWNEDNARIKLLELFEAWGPMDPASIKGRRLLSSVIFS